MTDAAPTGAPPSADTLRRARAYWEQAQADLKEGRRKRKTGAQLDGAFLSFQAAINALTALCYLHGEVRVPNHSTAQLAALLEGHDPRLGAVQASALALEAVQGLNPYARDRDEAAERRQSGEAYDHAAAILKSVRGYLKSERRRFFAP